jgi:hypothetical protein
MPCAGQEKPQGLAAVMPFELIISYHDMIGREGEGRNVFTAGYQGILGGLVRTPKSEMDIGN